MKKLILIISLLILTSCSIKDISFFKKTSIQDEIVNNGLTFSFWLNNDNYYLGITGYDFHGLDFSKDIFLETKGKNNIKIQEISGTGITDDMNVLKNNIGGVFFEISKKDYEKSDSFSLNIVSKKDKNIKFLIDDLLNDKFRKNDTLQKYINEYSGVYATNSMGTVSYPFKQEKIAFKINDDIGLFHDLVTSKNSFLINSLRTDLGDGKLVSFYSNKILGDNLVYRFVIMGNSKYFYYSKDIEETYDYGKGTEYNNVYYLLGENESLEYQVRTSEGKLFELKLKKDEIQGPRVYDLSNNLFEISSSDSGVGPKVALYDKNFHLLKKMDGDCFDSSYGTGIIAYTSKNNVCGIFLNGKEVKLPDINSDENYFLEGNSGNYLVNISKDGTKVYEFNSLKKGNYFEEIYSTDEKLTGIIAVEKSKNNKFLTIVSDVKSETENDDSLDEANVNSQLMITEFYLYSKNGMRRVIHSYSKNGGSKGTFVDIHYVDDNLKYIIHPDYSVYYIKYFDDETKINEDDTDFVNSSIDDEFFSNEDSFYQGPEFLNSGDKIYYIEKLEDKTKIYIDGVLKYTYNDSINVYEMKKYTINKKDYYIQKVSYYDSFNKEVEGYYVNGEFYNDNISDIDGINLKKYYDEN